MSLFWFWKKRKNYRFDPAPMKFRLVYSDARCIERDYDSWEEAARFARSHQSSTSYLVAIQLIGRYSIQMNYTTVEDDIKKSDVLRSQENCL